jgi:hypothetical protein
LTDFRCGVDPQGTIQQCTSCGKPGHWSEAGCQGIFAPPNGHTIRADGTLACPRAVGDLEERIRLAEDIIRAKNRLIEAMYNSDLSAGWPTDASTLESAYQERYGVRLETD